MQKIHWTSKVNDLDDFGNVIHDQFVDGKTKQGPWAIMTPECHKANGCGFGIGRGQLYTKQKDGRWLSIRGGSES